MTTFNTGNPVGSSDPRDLYDNAENADFLINGDQPAYNDRTGMSRKSWAGIESEFAAFIASSGYEFIGDYAAGITITGYQQIVRDVSGEFWRLSGSTVLPYTTTGSGLPEGGAFVAVGDAALRQDLASSAAALGASLVSMEGGPTVEVAVSARVIRVSSRAAMKAYDVPAGYQFSLEEGGRSGLFVVKSGTAPSDPQEGIYVVLANGNYAERIEKRFLTPEMFGAVSDGVADDTLAWQEAERLSAGFVFGKFGATYLCTDTVSVTNPIKTDLNGSTVNFSLTTTVPGFYVKSDNAAITNGTVNVTGTTMGGNAHSLACITSGVQSTGQGWRGLRVSEIYASTNRSDAGATISLLGACNNFVIENITFPDNPNMAIGVGCEWGGANPLTGHPHNGKISNIVAGALTAPATFPKSNFVVWMSSCFNIEVSDVRATQCYGLVGVHAGDNGNQYAPGAYKDLVGTGIKVRGIGCPKVTGEAVRVTGKGSSTPDILPMAVEIDGVRAIADPAAATTYAFYGEQFDGPSIKNFYFEGFTNGVNALAFADNLTIEHGKIALCDNYGIQVGSISNPAISPTVRHVEFVKNNQSSGATTANAAVRYLNTRHGVVENCVFGEDGLLETQKYSIALETNSLDTELNNNHTFSVAASGFAYVTGSSVDTAKNVRGINNTAESGVPLLAGPPIFQIQADGTRHFVDDAIPTSGTFAAGDKVFFTAPAAAGWVGAVCTVGGTVGTWKRFGAIEA